MILVWTGSLTNFINAQDIHLQKQCVYMLSATQQKNMIIYIYMYSRRAVWVNMQ